MTRKGDCFGVLLYRIGEVLYNDHVVGTPPRVVKLASIEPQWEVSSFLAQLSAIIPAYVCSVKSGSGCGAPAAPPWLINQYDRSACAFDHLSRPNYSTWPGLAPFRPENLAYNNMYGKIEQAIACAPFTEFCCILNGRVRGNLINTLQGRARVGTEVI